MAVSALKNATDARINAISVMRKSNCRRSLKGTPTSTHDTYDTTQACTTARRKTRNYCSEDTRRETTLYLDSFEYSGEKTVGLVVPRQRTEISICVKQLRGVNSLLQI